MMGAILIPHHMRKTLRFPNGTVQRMQSLVRQAETATELRRILSILLGSLNMPASEIGQLVGYNEHYIRHFWSRFRTEGEKALKVSRGAGNKNRALLSAKEEEDFLLPFFEKAKRGGILIVDDVHRAYEKQFRRAVHHSVIYNLLHRHGWRKIAPRPSHPKSSQQAQESFKTSFPPERPRGSRRSG